MKQNLSRYFGFLLIFTMLFTGMCQNVFSTDSSLSYPDSNSRSLTSAIAQLSNHSSMLEFNNTRTEPIPVRRNLFSSYTLWSLASLLLAASFYTDICIRSHHSLKPLSVIIHYIHQQDGEKPPAPSYS